MGGFLSGRTSLTTVQTADLAANAVTSAKILDGAVTAGKLASGAGGASTSDMRLAFLMIAENAGDRLSMDDGIADPFKDESDIDTSGSANQTYDAAGDFYSNPDGDVLISTSGLTPVGDMTSSGGLAAAFDRTLHETTANSCTTASDSATGRVGIDWGSGVTKSVGKIKMYGPTNSSIHNAAGSHDIFLDLIGHTSDAPASATLLGDAAAVSNTAATYNMTATTTATVTTAFRFHWLDCHSASSNAQWVISELEFYQTLTTANMTIVSNAFTATAVPATGRIHIQVHPVDAISINTDLTAEISRDGGSNWTVATLALTETLKDGTLAYEDNSVDISSQPSGTAMKYRVKTLNLKEVQIHGAVLQWST